MWQHLLEPLVWLSLCNHWDTIVLTFGLLSTKRDYFVSTKENKHDRLNVRIEKSLKDDIKWAANLENRSLASYIINLVKKDIEIKRSGLSNADIEVISAMTENLLAKNATEK